MAISIKDRYPSKVDTTDAAYPQGKARNVTVTLDGTGTPFEKDLVNDIMGLQQAIYKEASITPSGTPDTADMSQQLEGIKKITLANGMTTLELINSIEVYASDVVLDTSGFTTSGDGGSGQWKQNGVTGQTVSQAPAQLVDALLNDGLGNQWALVGELSARKLGAKGVPADDTGPIDALFGYSESNPSGDGTVLNGARAILLTVDAPVLNFGTGEYNYSGTGYTPIINKAFKVVGDSPASVTINILTDVHLVNPTNASKVMAYIEFSNIKTVGGRGAFYNEKNDAGNVGHGKRVYNCVFSGYTSVAFGSTQESDARWAVTNTIFEGGDSGTPVGLLLPNEIAEPEIGGCNTFAGNKYDIILSGDGISEMMVGPTNNFFNITGRAKEADIWMIPNSSGQGTGVRLFGNRHSNENLDVTDPNILIADQNTSLGSHVFDHLTTLSTGQLNGMTVDLCSMNSTGSPVSSSAAVGYILSYTPNVSGLRVIDNTLGQWRPFIIEYASGITAENVEDGGSVTNYGRLTTGRKGLNAYDINEFSNIPGAGLFEYDNKFNGGGSGCLMTYSDGTVGLTKVQNASNTRNWSKGVNVTQTDIIDAAGGTTGSTFQYQADQNVVASVVTTNLKAGQTLWIEADVKKSAARPLSTINLEYQLQSKVITYQIQLTDDWQRISIPVIVASNSHTGSTFSVVFTPVLFLDVGVTDSFDVGRFCLYHSQGPVEYALTSI